MTTFVDIKETAAMLIEAGDRATVEAWRDAAKAKVTAGGGQLRIMTSTSVAGKSAGFTLVADPLLFLRACLEALAEADSDDAGDAATRIIYPQL